MSPRHKLEPSSSAKTNKAKLSPMVAGATALALGASGVFLVASPAGAAPGYSEAEARYFSGSLFERSLDDIVAIAGERAVANGTSAEVVTESGNLDLSVLGDTLQLQVAEGVDIPLTVAEAGAVTQYAEATQTGSSRAGAGTLTDQGVIDLDAAPGAPESLSFDLSDLLTDELTAAVADASLTAGVTTATADQTAAGVTTGDYNIAGLQANITSPVLTGVSADLVASGEALDQVVAAALGADGSLVSDLTGVLNTVGTANVNVAASTDLSTVVTDVLQARTVLGVDGPVQVDLTTGEITVDIAALLAANGRDLNDLAPGEEIVNAELIGFVTADVDQLLNGLVGEVQTAVSAALATTDLTLEATVGEVDAPLLVLSVDGTLGEISSGAVAPVISLGDLELDGALLSGPITAVVQTVLGLQLNTLALDAELAPLYPALDGVLSDLVSLRANLQESQEGTFAQTALRLEVLNYTNAGEALSLNLGQAAVGPNAAPTVDVAPTILGVTPAFGPEAGGTEVTINGTDLTGVNAVNFGGVPGTDLTVVSPTQLTVRTPAGVGPVDIVASGATGTATLQNGFSYVPAPVDNEAGTVVSVTPTSGPEVGGTEVTLVGAGFAEATGVDFGNTPGVNFTVVSDNEIRVTSPAGEGAVAVVVTGAPNGSIQAPVPFNYIAPVEVPEVIITSVAPNTGPAAGGTVVTIIGENFMEGDTATFGDVAAISTVVVSPTELRAITPNGAGVVDVAVLRNDGSGGFTLPGGFTYIARTPAPAPVPDGNGNENGGVVNGGGNGNDGNSNGGNVPVNGNVSGGNGDSFENCDAAAAAGMSNFASNDANLDRDGDGIACDTDGTDSATNMQTVAEKNLADTGVNGAQAAGIGGGLALLLGGLMLALRRKFAA